jgi:putative transposase
VVSVKRQCELLALNRSTVYYQPRPVRREGEQVGRLHVGKLMLRMGIRALYRAPRTSLPARAAKIYPYLLSGLSIERANQVWTSDISYLPMAHGFLYLVAILDVSSRKVMAFRLSNTLTPDFCVAALREALQKYGAPEIFNTDQGAQFTSRDWIKVLDAGVKISMDGKGRWIDNVFIE